MLPLRSFTNARPASGSEQRVEMQHLDDSTALYTAEDVAQNVPSMNEREIRVLQPRRRRDHVRLVRWDLRRR